MSDVRDARRCPRFGDLSASAVLFQALSVDRSGKVVQRGIRHLRAGNDPTTLGVEIFDDVNPGVQTAAGGVVDGWSATFSVFGGTYQIDLTGAGFSNSTGGGGQLPALGGWGLALVAGLLAINGWRRLRSRFA